MIINKSGVVIRLKVSDVRIQGRATQGVRLINLGKRNDQISSVCKVTTETEEPEVQNAEVVSEVESPIVDAPEIESAEQTNE
jgi:DNA gyrase subunit A